MSFGATPTMREVLPGEHAILKLGEYNQWEIVETEYGEKFKLRIQLFSHSSIESSQLHLQVYLGKKLLIDLYFRRKLSLALSN